MDIISTILLFIASIFIILLVVSILLFIGLIFLLIYLFKQAKRHPKGVFYTLIVIIIFSAIFGIVSWETIIGAITGATGVIGSLIVMISKWNHLKKEF